MEAKEPAIAYNTPYVQGLKDRIIASLDQTADEYKLEQCLELLENDSMPCCFTEEELDEVIRHSEASGNATKEEVQLFFARWGH